MRHRAPDGRLDLRADKPAHQDKRGQRDPYGRGGIEACIDQDTNDRGADDVMGEIERIGDQPERSQILRAHGYRRGGGRGGGRAPAADRGHRNQQHRSGPDGDRHETQFIGTTLACPAATPTIVDRKRTASLRPDQKPTFGPDLL